MASYYSDRYAVAQDSSTYIGRVPRCDKVGDQVWIEGTATIATNLATSDKIYLFPIQKGARVVSFTHEWGDLDGGSALVMDLGYISGNQDAFLAASTNYQAADTTVASGGGANSLTLELTELVYDEAVAAANDDVGFTVTTGASSLAATRTITFRALVAMA